MLRSMLFDGLTKLATRYTWWVLGVSILVTVLSLVSAVVYPGVEVKTNFADMMGPDEEVSKTQKYVEANFPNVNTVQVLLEGHQPERLAQVARELEARLVKEPLVRDVYLEQPVDFFIDHSLLYVPEDELQQMVVQAEDWAETGGELLADPSVYGLFTMFEEVASDRMSQNNSVSMLTSQVFGRMLLDGGPWDSPGMEVGIKMDTQPMQDALDDKLNAAMKDTPLPSSEEKFLESLESAESILGLVADVLDQGRSLEKEEFAERVQRLRELDFERMGANVSRYNYNPDKTALLVDISGKENLGDMAKVEPFMSMLYGVMDELSLKNPDVSITATGLPAMVYEEGESIVNNFILVTVLGFIGILAVFIIGFERVGLPSLAAIPLVMGVIWGFGIIGITTGSLTLFAMMFPILLFGIGIDFAIHIISGYSSERAEGLEPEAALRAMYDKVGSGLMTGAVTTAAAFLVMLFSDFYGLRDMGRTAGTGILMALLAMVTVLPALLMVWDRRYAAKGNLIPDVPFTALEQLAGGIQRHRYWILAGFIVATMVFGYFWSKVTIDQNYLNIVPQNLTSVLAQDRVLEKYETSNEFVSVFADNLDEVERIRELAESSNTFSQVIAPSIFVPSDQASKLPHMMRLKDILLEMKPEHPPPTHAYDEEAIDVLRERLAGVKRIAMEGSVVSNTLYSAEVRSGLGRQRDLLNRIDGRLNTASADRLRYLDELLSEEIYASHAMFLGMTEHTEVRPDDLPPSILSRMRGEDGKWMMLLKGSGDVWEPGFRSAFMEELRDVAPAGTYAGLVPSWDFLLNLLLGELPVVFAAILGMVGLIVLIDLRSIRGALLALVPLGVGLIWSIGITGMIGLPFNIISVIAVPLIVGIGIDDGVHIYHRIRKERTLAPALAHSGKAVILTSMTTGIGFGSLLLSIHPGLFSLGLVTTIGIASCLLVSLFLMPALVAIFEEDLIKPAADEGESA